MLSTSNISSTVKNAGFHVVEIWEKVLNIPLWRQKVKILHVRKGLAYCPSIISKKADGEMA